MALVITIRENGNAFVMYYSSNLLFSMNGVCREQREIYMIMFRRSTIQ